MVDLPLFDPPPPPARKRRRRRVRREALQGVPEKDVRAITDDVPPEQIVFFVSLLSSKPVHYPYLLRSLREQPWFTQGTYGSQNRRVRILRDAAFAAGYPVCTTPADGYWLGSSADLRTSAAEMRRQEEGKRKRAEDLESMAREFEAKGL